MDIPVFALAVLVATYTVVIGVRFHPLASLVSTYRARREGVHTSAPGAVIPFALKEGQTIVSVEDTTTAMCFYIGTDVLEEKNYD
jgi:hypothetical protein